MIGDVLQSKMKFVFASQLNNSFFYRPNSPSSHLAKCILGMAARWWGRGFPMRISTDRLAFRTAFGTTCSSYQGCSSGLV